MATRVCSDVLQNLLRGYVEDSGPGVALVVATDGAAPALACRGLADLAAGVEIGPDTAFDLASAGKTMTAVAAMRLAARGDLDLEAPISTYLDVVEPPSEGRAIVVRDLLGHTAGLEDYLAQGMYTPPSEMTAGYVRQQLGRWSREARPGLVHAYSNTNYVVLSWIVEAVTGVSFGNHLRDALWEPFGLRGSFLQGQRTPDRPRIARGYRNLGYGLPEFELSDELTLDTVGDGGVFSTLNDLVRWQALLWGGELLDQEALAAMTMPVRNDDGGTFPYGFGLQVEQVRMANGAEATWIGHGGSWVGTTVMVGRYREARTSVIVLANEFMAPVERLSQRAFALVAGR